MSAAPGSSATRLELTAAQRGLWYAQQLDPDNVVLNIAHYLDVPGTIDPSTYRSAWVTTVDEIDALHATFGEDADGPTSWSPTASSGTCGRWTCATSPTRKRPRAPGWTPTCAPSSTSPRRR